MRMVAGHDERVSPIERVGAVGFVEAIGERAALFGDPRAGLECWIWPLEIFRDLRIGARTSGGAPIDLAALEPRATVLPHGFELRWESAAALVTLRACASRRERAIVLELDRRPRDLALELVLRPIFRPMWPAGLGGQIARIDPGTGALVLSEELGRFASVIGGLATIRAYVAPLQVPEERGSDAGLLRLRVPSTPPSGAPVAIVVAGAEIEPGALSDAARRGGEQSATGEARARRAIDAALALWRRLAAQPSDVRGEQEAHWRAFLDRTTRFTSSDPAHDRAFAWSKIAIERAWTEVDGVGRAVVAGVGPSRGTARPGFAWLFGGDALAATRASCASGDFEGSRELLRFVASTQREDGKLLHERTLSARLCDWTGDYPYAYYKAQVTPGFVACLAAHWRASGDDALARELWPAARRALEWCASVLDGEGRMHVPEAGIAAVEAGPLCGRVASEVFLEGIHLSALAGARELAGALALDASGLELEAREERARAAFESFWSADRGRYGFARLVDGGRCDDLTAYLGLALSRGIGDPARALASAMQISHPELCADWGARMFSTRSSIYAPEHYNVGSVFPYLTGFVVLALYSHALAPSAHQLLESQVALCGFDGAGLVPEHLEGDLARTPPRGVPHQVFSSGAILQSIVHGLFGLAPDARASALAIRSQLPRHWERARLESFRLGGTRLGLELVRTRKDGASELSLVATHTGGPPAVLRWAPRVAPLSRADAHGSVDGERTPLEVRTLASGALEIAFPGVELAAGTRTLAVRLREGPEPRLDGATIERGAPSRQVRMSELVVEGARVRWRLHGRAGTRATLPLASDLPVRVGRASLAGGALVVEFPPEAETRDGFASAWVDVEVAP